MPLLADDDVVMHRNAEGLGHLDNLSGHLDVGAGRRRVAGGMVVHQPTTASIILMLLQFFECPIALGPEIGGGKS
jgi:hypothetical protein